jgi:ribosomal protein RSM22 (predicted rRNA methylase)
LRTKWGNKALDQPRKEMEIINRYLSRLHGRLLRHSTRFTSTHTKPRINIIDLPSEMTSQIAKIVTGYPRGQLRNDCLHLATGDTVRKIEMFGPREAMAHLATRTPEEFGAIHSVFYQLTLQRDQGRWPYSILDYGSKTGGALWSAAQLFPDLKRYHGVDKSKDLHKLFIAMTETDPFQVEIELSVQLPPKKADVVLAAFTLSNMPDKERKATVTELWKRVDDGGVLVLIEHGTEDGFEIVSNYRADLISSGGTVIAPVRSSCFS